MIIKLFELLLSQKCHLFYGQLFKNIEKNFEHDTTLPIPDEGSMEINAVKLCTDSAIRTLVIGKSNYKLI